MGRDMISTRGRMHLYLVTKFLYMIVDWMSGCNVVVAYILYNNSLS